MAKARSVSLEYVDHEVGLWCANCMMATGIAFWVALTTDTGETTVMDTSFCTEPGGDEHEVEA